MNNNRGIARIKKTQLFHLPVNRRMVYESLPIAMMAFFLFVAGGLNAQENNDDSGDKTYYSENRVQSIYDDEEKPAPVYGFRKNFISFSFLGGATMLNGGSFISNEKEFDDNVRYKQYYDENYSDADDIDKLEVQFYNMFTLPGPVPNMQLFPGPVYQMDVEYGYSDKIGMGVTAIHFTIDTVRHDVLPGAAIDYDKREYVRKDYVEPFPHEYNLYKGTGVMYQVLYHPVQGTWDPYVALRIGLVGFDGTAHGGTYPSVLEEYDHKIQNGNGLIGGAAVGVNLYLTETLGLKWEYSTYMQQLNSSLFSGRTLNTSHFQAGLFFRYDSKR